VLRRLLLLTSVVVFADTALFAAVTPILPELVDDFGLTKTSAGVLFGAYPAGVGLFAIPSGLIAARIGVRPTVIAGLVLMGVASLEPSVGSPERRRRTVAASCWAPRWAPP
jgi:MFS family permease